MQEVVNLKHLFCYTKLFLCDKMFKYENSWNNIEKVFK